MKKADAGPRSCGSSWRPKGHPIPPAFLALIHQLVGASDQRLNPVAQAGKGGANRHRDVDVAVSGSHARAPDEDPKPLTESRDPALVHVDQGDEELLPAPAAYQVKRPCVACQRLSDGAQRLVAHVVTMLVVDLLEVIDVHEQHTEGPAVPVHLVELGAQVDLGEGTVP